MSDIHTNDLRAELLDRHAGAINGLYRPSARVPVEKWALVVDVVADRTVLTATTQNVHAQGFTLDASVGSGNDVSVPHLGIFCGRLTRHSLPVDKPA